ncbi:radical SAM family heme chaperone HemW [bacterium]|nr:radical SAM family heme chaperone HemW [bacterium]
MKEYPEKKELGLYIHIPFCERKCRYCSFYSIPYDERLVLEYCDSIVEEIRLHKNTIKKYKLISLYIGGGTPSVIPLNILTEFIVRIKKNINILNKSEFTIEVNPNTLTERKIKTYRELGVNRISVGVQSFNDTELKFLGRIHTASQAVDCLKRLIKSGIDNVSIDLIYGIPEQKLENWANTIREAISYNVKHISVYNLSYDKGTKLFEDLTKNKFKKVNFIKEEFMFFFMLAFFKEKGFLHYEISSLAKSEKYRSKHNLNYWQDGEYLGFGASAHSYLIDNKNCHQRWGNISNVDKYIDRIKNNESPKCFAETLNNDELLREYLMLRLRLIEGFSLREFDRIFGAEIKRKLISKLDFFIDNCLLQESGGMLSIPNNRLFVSNEIIALLLSKL